MNSKPASLFRVFAAWKKVKLCWFGLNNFLFSTWKQVLLTFHDQTLSLRGTCICTRALEWHSSCKNEARSPTTFYTRHLYQTPRTRYIETFAIQLLRAPALEQYWVSFVRDRMKITRSSIAKELHESFSQCNRISNYVMAEWQNWISPIDGIISSSSFERSGNTLQAS